MTGALRDLLDDAADVAVRDRRIDAGTVLARSGRRRARLRSTGSLLMLGAAAAIAVAVAVTLGAVPALLAPVTAAQSSTQVGLPDRWYFTPSFAPPVTRRHMPAASMLLGGDGNDPVLVSADSKTYARLPWGPDDAMAALSADGTRVAWATQGQKQSTVHLLRLSDGEQVDTALPSGSGKVNQLVWAGVQVYARTDGGRVRVMQHGGRATAVLVCSCAEPELGVDGAGRLVQADDEAQRLGLPELPVVRTTMSGPYPVTDAPSWSRRVASAEHPAWSYLSSPVLAVDPARSRAASTRWGQIERAGDSGPGWYVVAPGAAVGTEVALRIAARVEVADAEVLAWTGSGILVRVDTIDPRNTARVSTLRLLDPAGRWARTVSARAEGANVPLAVAPGLVGAGEPITTAPPQFSNTDRARYATAQLWRSNYPYWQLMTVGALAAITALIVLRRRQRRLP